MMKYVCLTIANMKISSVFEFHLKYKSTESQHRLLTSKTTKALIPASLSLSLSAKHILLGT